MKMNQVALPVEHMEEAADFKLFQVEEEKQ
jgi:hypothetical protein